jgi:NCS1 family nucleobase:cation symporter-1
MPAHPSAVHPSVRARDPVNPEPSLINEDIRPTTGAERRWSVINMAALWIGMVVCVPTYMLAGGLIKEGMNWWQALLTVLLGNLIVLVPMILNGHPGTAYGVPFPVLSRASFGTRGAHVPALLRGLVACGWFGIQTWIGGAAIYHLLVNLSDGAIVGPALPVLDINLAQASCFLAFWAVQLAVIWNGIESIRIVETLAAPFLIVMGLVLLGWAYVEADGFGPMLATPSAFVEGGERQGEFWQVFFPSLTAMVGFWATLSLNIPDFTRYARSQKAQVLGQALGLPFFMLLFSFIGVAVTSATVAIFGEAIWDPTELLGRMEGGVAVVASLLALSVATLSTNIAANVVSPANALINLSPQRISFRVGGLITAGLGIAMFPWKLLESAGDYIYVWLAGYSALLGPLGGILIVDYFVLRDMKLDIDALYRHDGPYGYTRGWNLWALVALAAGVLPNVPGFLHKSGFVQSVPPIFEGLYIYAWFVGFAISGLVYGVACRRR